MAAAEKHSTPGPPVVVTLGNPNTGKSSLFNVLTGLNQKVGNFPGVTVDYLAGQFELAGQSVRLIDVPGTYSLAAQSPDEIITLDVLLGNVCLRKGLRKTLQQDKLHWDNEKFAFTNLPEANRYLRREYREGWKLDA